MLFFRRSLIHQALVLPLLFLFFVVVSVNGQVFGSFKWFCDLQYEPIVELEWDPVSNTFKLLDKVEDRIEHNQDDDETRQRRRTLVLDSEDDEDDEEVASVSALRGTHGEDYQYMERALYTYTHDFNQSQSQVYTNKTMNSYSQNNSAANDKPSIHLAEHDHKNRTAAIIVQARKCPCWKDPYGTVPQDKKNFYCPLARTHCGLAATAYTRDGKTLTSKPVTTFYVDEPGCLDVSRQRSFARNVWPIVTIWYLAMALCLLMTRPGRHAIGCCLSTIWPGWNVRAVNRILRTHADLTNRIVIRRQMAESGGFEVTFEWTSSPPNNGNGNDYNNNDDDDGDDNREEVLLRAKTFHYNQQHDGAIDKPTPVGQGVSKLVESTTEGPQEMNMEKESMKTASHLHRDHQNIDSDDDDDEDLYISCAICHTEIEEGARVGDLPCNHILHIECLKTWILRRNVCPLCLAADIATPRRQTTTTTRSDSTPQAQRRRRHLPDLVVTGE